MIAEAANDRVGLLNLDADGRARLRNNARQGVQVLADRWPARTDQELRGRQPFELSAHEVKAFRVAYDLGFLFAQAKPPCCEKVSQLGEDDLFELPPRTGQDHEVIRIANQPQVSELESPFGGLAVSGCVLSLRTSRRVRQLPSGYGP